MPGAHLKRQHVPWPLLVWISNPLLPPGFIHDKSRKETYKSAILSPSQVHNRIYHCFLHVSYSHIRKKKKTHEKINSTETSYKILNESIMLSQFSQGQWRTTKKNQFKLETSCPSPRVLNHTYSYIIWNAQAFIHMTTHQAKSDWCQQRFLCK